MKKIMFASVGSLLALSGIASTVYVSPSGTADAAGTKGDPLALSTAFTRAGVTEIRALTSDFAYEVAAPLVLKNGLAVRGWDAEADAPVDKAGRERVVFKATATGRMIEAGYKIGGFTLAGLTLTRPDVGGLEPLVYVQNCIDDGMTITNCVFHNIVHDATAVQQQGGGLHVDFASVDKATVVDCVFSNIAAKVSGGAMYPGAVTVRNCYFADCRTTQHGAALAGGAATRLIGCFFTNNVAEGFGGVLINGLGLATNCTFVANRAQGSNGGALYLNTSDACLVDCVFRDNETQTGDYNNGGGAVYTYTVSLACTNCTFVGNSATGRGGAIYHHGLNASGDPVLSLDGCTFTNNTAALVGGGVFAWRASNRTTSGTVTRCTFVDNKAANAGGLSCRGYYRLAVTGCDFIANKATGSAGAIDGGPYTSGENNSRIDVTNCTFRANAAPACGVGNSLWGSFVDCTFVGNQATGGANAGIELFVGSASAKETAYSTDIVNCGFFTNVTTSGARALCVYAEGNSGWTFASQVRIIGTKFVDNYSSVIGGATENNYSAALLTLPTLLVDRCVFSGTDKVVTGGGLSVSATVEGALRNSLFYRNFDNAKCGAGSKTPGSFAGANVNVWNCTFAFNDTKVGHCGALRLDGDLTVPRVRNCIFWENKIQGLNGWDNSQIDAGQKAAYYDCYDYFGKMSTEGHNIITGGTPGFVDVDNGDLHLAKGSRLIDIGHNDPWMFAAGAKPLDGRHRVENGIVDFGCYEYRTPPGLLLLLK